MRTLRGVSGLRRLLAWLFDDDALNVVLDGSDNPAFREFGEWRSALFALGHMTILEVCEKYTADDRCRELLARLRWPNGVECSRCKSTDVKALNGKVFWCAKCEYQFSVTAGTIFHDSHLPLLKWFAAVYLMCESKKGMSALQLKRMLGVSYKTAWYLCHRIRHSMQALGRELLTGTVEMDETYVGGVARGKGRGPHLSGNKEIVIGIRQRGGELRLFHAQDAKSGTLAKYIRENISETVSVIITDDATAYPPASLLKRGIVGTWHRISVKHLSAYLDEMAFRFNRRNITDLFEDTLRHMVRTDPLTFAELTVASSK